jgi:pimeloyl-ACP methyl ester carboxylesterase
MYDILLKLLGMTFATMFPDSVERLILDGVVDPVDYYSAQWRISS